MSRVGINGFGRIGRVFLRNAIEKNTEILVINEPAADLKTMSYLLKHDSTHGIFPGLICTDEEHLIVNNQKIKVFHEKDPRKVPWKCAGVKYVVECSGLFTTLDKAKALLEGGAEKVLISAPSKDAPMYVYGVNLSKYRPDEKVSERNLSVIHHVKNYRVYFCTLFF